MKRERLENLVLICQIEKKNESINKKKFDNNLIGGEAVIGVKVMLKL